MAQGSLLLQNLVALLARICLSAIFIMAGIQKLVSFPIMTATLAQLGMPYAKWLLILAISFELGGAALLFCGLFTRFGAFLLFVFVIVVTFFFHAFWKFAGTVLMDESHRFLNSFTILGGLLYAMAYGAGHFALDRLRNRPKSTTIPMGIVERLP